MCDFESRVCSSPLRVRSRPLARTRAGGVCSRFCRAFRLGEVHPCIIDCDSHCFPVKFLEPVSAKYPHSPRVVRQGDNVRSVLPDGTLIKNQAPKGRWHLDTRDQHVDWEGFDVHVLISENRELLYTWDRDLGCELARAYNDAVAQDLKECAHPESTSVSPGCFCRMSRNPAARLKER
jgi:hypothetical protein